MGVIPMKSNGMTNKNPVTHPRSDFSPYRKKVYDAPKIRAKPNFYFLKKGFYVSFFLKVAYKDRTKRICTIYRVSILPRNDFFGDLRPNRSSQEKICFLLFFRPSKTALNHAFKFNVTSTSLAKQTQNECRSKLFGTFLTKIFEKFDLRPNQKTYWTQLSATLTHTP